MTFIGLTPTMISSLRLALAATSHGDLASRLGTGPELPEGLLAGQVLTHIAQGIAGRDEALAGRLINYADQVAHAVQPNEKARAWRLFTEVVQGASAASANASSPAVSFPVLQEGIRLANDPGQRKEWLRTALVSMGLQDPDWILKDAGLDGKLNRRIYLFFDRGDDDLFHLNIKTPSSQKIVLSVRTPLTARPLSTKDISNLLARGLLIKAGEKIGGDTWINQTRHFSPGALVKSPPTTVFHEAEAIVLGSDPLLKDVSSFAKVHGWMNEAGRAAASSTFAETKAIAGPELGDRMYQHYRQEITDKYGDKVTRPFSQSWLDLGRTTNIRKTSFRSFSSILMAPFRTMFSVAPKASLKESALEISLGKYGKDNALVMVRGARAVFETMTPDDLFEIIWRVSVRRSDREFKRTLRETVGLNQVRRGDGLSPEAMAQRAYLKLLLAFHRARTEAPEGPPEKEPAIRIEGIVEALAKKRFAQALTAVQRQQEMTPIESVSIAWDEVLGVRRWFLGESGEEHEDPVVEVTPLGEEALLFVKGRTTALTSLDWLYLFSVMAANPDQCIRVSPGKREIVTGRTGDAIDLYSGIAANRIFAPFGTFDPAARLPEGIDLALPMGIPATANPKYLTASPEIKRAYLRALRWFGAADIPTKWQPSAQDDFETARLKYRQMMLAWHPDKGGTPEQVNLVIHSGGHWKAILKVYGN